MKKTLIILIAATCLISCSNQSSTKAKSTDNKATTTSNIVEVMYMHGKQRCVTCVAIETLATEFVKEINNDKVVMKSIDYSTAEGEAIANKYRIASSSLLVVKGDQVTHLTLSAFRYARNNPALFREKLTEAIEKML